MSNPYTNDDIARFADHWRGILQQEHLLAVTGPACYEKSNLFGLLPGLAVGMLCAGVDFRMAILRPGDYPMLNLAQALLDRYALGPELVGEERLPRDAEDIGPDAALIAAELRRGPSGLRGLLQTAAARRRRNPGRTCHLLVRVEQFEELFTYAGAQGRKEGDEEAFVELLLQARGELTGDAPPCRIYVAITMQAEFRDHCARFPNLLDAINRAQYLHGLPLPEPA